MTGDADSKNNTVGNALVHYQQHLRNELQRLGTKFRENGSLHFSEEDNTKQYLCHRELQNINTILQSQQQSQSDWPNQSAYSTTSKLPSSQIINGDKVNHEHSINHLTGQGVSADDSQIPVHTTSPPTHANTRVRLQDRSQSPQPERGSIMLGVSPARQRSLTSLPEVSLPSDTSASPSKFASLYTPNSSGSVGLHSGPQSLNVPLQSHDEPSLGWTIAGNSQVQPGLDSHTSHQVSAESISNTEPATEDARLESPEVEHTRRRTSWQSANRSDVIIQPPATPSFLDPGQRQENPWNRVPSVSIHKEDSPPSSIVSHGRRHLSTPSSSTDELVNRPSSATASYATQSLSPPPPPVSPPPPPPRPSSYAYDDHTPRLRPRPAFEVPDPGIFSIGVGNGMNSVSSAQAHPNSKSSSIRVPSKNGYVSSLPLHSKQQVPIKTTNVDSLPDAYAAEDTISQSTSANQTKYGPELQFSRPFSNTPVDATLAESSNMNGEVGNQILATDKARGNHDQRRLDTSIDHGNDPSTLAPNIPQHSGGITQNPFQRKSSFNKEVNFSSPVTHQPIDTASSQPPKPVKPNQLSSSGLNSGDDVQTRQDMSERIKPQRPALSVLEQSNSIYPNELRQLESKPGPRIDPEHTRSERSPPDQIVHRPSDRQGSVTANQAKQNRSIKTDLAEPRGQQSSTSRRQKSSAYISSGSNIYKQLHDALVVADSADHDELATLKRLQDDWNQEEDIREAKEYSMARDSHNNIFNSRVASDSVQFAASPNQGQAPAKVIVNPVRSTPANKHQAATTLNSKDDVRKFIRQAGLTIIQKHIPNPSPASDTSAQRHHINDSATKIPECTVCGDKLTSASEAVTLPCMHDYHPNCLASGFQHALAGGKLFICCRSIPAPIDTISSLLPPQFVANYKAKVIERSTQNPIYCTKPGCASFVPPDHITGPLAKCVKCGFITCKMCRNPEHKGVCLPDKNGGMLMQLAENRNWCQCQRCKSVVERVEGCLHITCDCGHEFCYNCGEKWATCGAKCNRKS